MLRGFLGGLCLFLLVNLGICLTKDYGAVSGAVVGSSSVISAINQTRAANGVSPLSVNNKLMQSALNKAIDMCFKNYWNHDGFLSWPASVGYNYIDFGENLAYKFYDVDRLVAKWLASPTHRAALLDPIYKETGVAVYDCPTDFIGKGKVNLIVQHFGNPAIAAVQQQPKTKECVK